MSCGRGCSLVHNEVTPADHRNRLIRIARLLPFGPRLVKRHAVERSQNVDPVRGGGRFEEPSPVEEEKSFRLDPTSAPKLYERGADVF